MQTIGDQPAVGICGSGILEAISEMFRSGVLDARGALVGSHPLVRRRDGLNEFVLAGSGESGHGKDVLVTRRDVNEIQLAKGAIRAGIEILLAEAGITAEAIEDFIIAGAFGTYISVPSAIQVGMFPTLPLSRFRQVGNAAGAGARQMLVSTRQRELRSGDRRSVRIYRAFVASEFYERVLTPAVLPGKVMKIHRRDAESANP